MSSKPINLSKDNPVLPTASTSTPQEPIVGIDWVEKYSSSFRSLSGANHAYDIKFEGKLVWSVNGISTTEVNNIIGQLNQAYNQGAFRALCTYLQRNNKL